MVEEEKVQQNLDKADKLASKLKDYRKTQDTLYANELKQRSFIGGILFGVLLSLTAAVIDRYVYGGVNPSNSIYYTQYAMLIIFLTASLIVGGIFSWRSAVKSISNHRKETDLRSAELNKTLDDLHAAQMALMDRNTAQLKKVVNDLESSLEGKKIELSFDKK